MHVEQVGGKDSLSEELWWGKWGLDFLVFVLNEMNITLLDLFLELILRIYSCPTVVVCTFPS